MNPFQLGNVFHDAFEDIFFGEKLREYVRSMDIAHNNSICSGCEMRYLCGGGCKANTLHATGDFRGVDLYCSFIKRSIVESLFDAVEDPESDGAPGPGSEVVTSLHSQGQRVVL
jgi:radical SAM protein with 4Fe4S-binding SPASM domain